MTEMHHEGAMTNVDVSSRGDVDGLKGGAVGLIGVLFLCVTGSAPLAVTLFNTPAVIPWGSGSYGPGAFVFATIVLTVFSVAYVQMCLKVRAAGGMYTFISHGLGRPLAMMGGFSLLCAYGLFGASLIGGFATFTANDLKNYLSIDIPWIWLALLAVLIVVAIGYFDVEISAKVLGVALVTEVIIIMIFSLAVLFKGGNGGLDVSNLNPIASLNHGVAPGIGVFFAFWSWVGFEAAPNYAEESKDPVRTIPIAVYFSCVGVGVLYTFMSWMVVTAYGKGDAATNAFNAGTGTTPASVTVHGHTFISNTDTFVTGVFEAYAPKVFADIMNWLIVSGSVACAAALTNAGLRYWYAMGREGILPRALGKTHPRHKSPHVAIFTQGGISAVLCILFWFANAKAYDMYLDLAAQGVIWIVLVQAFTALSTFFYFRREHPTEQHWWKTIAAPWLGFIGQIYVLLLMYHNFYFLAAGNWYSNPSFTVPFPSIPTLGELQFNPIAVIGVVVPLAALLYAVMLRTTNPAKYEVLGRFVNEGAA